MSESCHNIEDLLPDFLDNNLDPHLRERVEKHIAACQKCRDNLALQQKWLLYRDAVTGTAQTAPEGLNQRIMAAVRAESTTQQSISKQKNVALWHKPWVWRSLAGSAAVVVLLVAVLQFLPDILASTSRTSMAESGNAVLTTAAGLQPTAANASTQMTKSAGGWTIISGQNFERAGLDLVIGYPSEAQVDTASDTFGCISSLPETAKDTIANILGQSEDVRLLYRLLPLKQAVILASFDDNQVNSRAEQIKNALAPCETPIQIEIIRTEDLQVKLTGLDQTLYDEVFPDPVADTSWIFILIGA